MPGGLFRAHDVTEGRARTTKAMKNVSYKHREITHLNTIPATYQLPRANSN